MNCIIIFIILLVIIIISNISLFNNLNIIERYETGNVTIDNINQEYQKLDNINNKDLNIIINNKFNDLKEKSNDITNRIIKEGEGADEILSTINYLDGYDIPIDNKYCIEQDIGESRRRSPERDEAFVAL